MDTFCKAQSKAKVNNRYMLKLYEKIWAMVMGFRMALTLADMYVQGWDREGSTKKIPGI